VPNFNYFQVPITVLSPNSPVYGWMVSIIFKQRNDTIGSLFNKGDRGLVQPNIVTFWKGKGIPYYFPRQKQGAIF
jgi:hypothetical protein